MSEIVIDLKTLEDQELARLYQFIRSDNNQIFVCGEGTDVEDELISRIGEIPAKEMLGYRKYLVGYQTKGPKNFRAEGAFEVYALSDQHAEDLAETEVSYMNAKRLVGSHPVTGLTTKVVEVIRSF